MKRVILSAFLFSAVMEASGQSSTCWGTAQTCQTWGDVESSYSLDLFGQDSGPGVFVGMSEFGFHGSHPPITDMPSCFVHCEQFAKLIFEQCTALSDNEESQIVNYEAACQSAADDNFAYCIADCVSIGQDSFPGN